MLHKGLAMFIILVRLVLFYKTNVMTALCFICAHLICNDL